MAMKNNQEYMNEDVILKKRYIFHDKKSLWMHLVDWYAFNKQEENRERIQQSVQAAAERYQLFGRQEKMDNDNAKENLVDIFCLGNIEKKIKVYRRVTKVDFAPGPFDLRASEEP